MQFSLGGEGRASENAVECVASHPRSVGERTNQRSVERTAKKPAYYQIKKTLKTIHIPAPRVSQGKEQASEARCHFCPQTSSQ